jgi:catechol 2,3-dioxygenase-like lactoylglutathione lyase family enzyme
VSDQSSSEQRVRLSSAVPVLPTTTISQAITFYEQLGFQTLHQDADYAIFRRDAVEVHVWLSTEPSLPGNSSCRIKVTNIEALYQEYQAKGLLEPHVVVNVKPWGAKEFVVFDPDRVLLTFVEYTR